MPKLVSIKRPFAKKTKNMSETNQCETNYKNLARKMQTAEDIFTKLAKVFSAGKRNLKNSTRQENKIKNTLNLIDDTIKGLADNNDFEKEIKKALISYLFKELQNITNNELKDDLSNLGTFYNKS